MNNFIRIQFMAVVGVLILSACSTSNEVVSNNFITKRKHNKGFHIDFKGKYNSNNEIELTKAEKTEIKTKVEVFNSIEENQTFAAINDNIETDIIDSKSNTIQEETVPQIEKNVFTSRETVLNNSKEIEKKSNKEQKIIAKHSFKKLTKSHQKDDTAEILILILCFLIPPLAVYLHEGSWNNRCWISLLLTCLVWVPGIIFALVVCLDLI